MPLETRLLKINDALPRHCDMLESSPCRNKFTVLFQSDTSFMLVWSGWWQVSTERPVLKEGPPTHAILSGNLILSRFTHLLKGFRRVFNKSYPVFGVFNESNPAFGEFSESFRRPFEEFSESFRRVFVELSQSFCRAFGQPAFGETAFGEFSESFWRTFEEPAFGEPAFGKPAFG